MCNVISRVSANLLKRIGLVVGAALALGFATGSSALPNPPVICNDSECLEAEQNSNNTGGIREVDWNPGIYSKSTGVIPSYICAGDSTSDNVKGIRVGFGWGELEGANPGDYRFDDTITPVIDALANCGGGNKRLFLVVLFQDSHADAYDVCAPKYLFEEGWVAIREDTTKTPRCTARVYDRGYAEERYKALLKELGTWIMNHPREELFEAVAIYGEWSIGSHYTPDRTVRIDLIQEYCDTMRAAAPRKFCAFGTGHFGAKATAAEREELVSYAENTVGIGYTFPDTHTTLSQFNSIAWSDQYCNGSGKLAIYADNQRPTEGHTLCNGCDIGEYFDVLFRNDQGNLSPRGTITSCSATNCRDADENPTDSDTVAFCATHGFITHKTNESISATDRDWHINERRGRSYNDTCPTNVTGNGWTCRSGRTP